MARFRKKPVEVEARQFDGLNADSILRWMGAGSDGYALGAPFESLAGTIVIPTLEGEMEARDGDWIIRGIKGEFYPCKPDIFEATYEPVHPASQEDQQG